MSRRRGERRHIYANVPTADGKRVAVRSSTVAGRLFGQQQLIEQQAENIRQDAERIKELSARLVQLEKQLAHLTGQRMVRVLVWFRLVSILVPALAEKPAASTSETPSA